MKALMVFLVSFQLLAFREESVEGWTSRTLYYCRSPARCLVTATAETAIETASLQLLRTPQIIFHLRDRRLLELQMSSDWGSFAALEDDDFEGMVVDRTDYAMEEDTQERKAKVGASLDPPTILQPSEPIHVPAGSSLELNEENVLGLLSACREELGTLFGYSAENRGVGITGGVDYVDMDGPIVVLSLKGRYWHQRVTVLDRVGNYLMQRIPEIVEVTVEDPYQLTDEANEVW